MGVRVHPYGLASEVPPPQRSHFSEWLQSSWDAPAGKYVRRPWLRHPALEPLFLYEKHTALGTPPVSCSRPRAWARGPGPGPRPGARGPGPRQSEWLQRGGGGGGLYVLEIHSERLQHETGAQGRLTYVPAGAPQELRSHSLKWLHRRGGTPEVSLWGF